MQRRKARQLVLRALYQQEFVNSPIDEVISELNPRDQEPYIKETLHGIKSHLPQLDELIEHYALGWRVERLAIVDRSILRLALYELLYSMQIPPEVAIDEAVELAKKYGTDNAPSFINGILDRAWKEDGESKTPADKIPSNP